MNHPLTSLAAPLAFIGMTQRFQTHREITGLLDPKKVLYAFLSVSVAVDLFISSTISIYAWKHRTGGGWVQPMTM